MSRPKIVVVGSSNTDLVIETDKLPVPGETVLGRGFMMAPGGKGANQAVAAARLGAEVTLVARIGNDLFGEQALRGFEKEGIHTDFVIQGSAPSGSAPSGAAPSGAAPSGAAPSGAAPSGAALIMVGGDGENLIAVAPGANAQLSVADVETARGVIERADFLMLQLEIPLSVVQYAATLAARAGVRVILDPAPATEIDDGLLAQVSIVTPNELEAERLTGVRVEDEVSARRAAALLRRRGAETVLLTRGAAGCFVSTAQSSWQIPAPRVESIDTTAAGDTFNGALAWALASGQPLRQAIETASFAAAISTTRRGAQPSMPTLDEL